MTAPSQYPPEVYATCTGMIDQGMVQRIFAGVATASVNKVTHLHVLFQSTGGTVADGVCLYNFFSTLPIDLTLYNGGSIASAAAIAYLGAKKRKASTHATFMLHRASSIINQPATAGRLKATTQSLVLDDQRTEAILRQHLNLSADQWKEIDQELWLSAAQAVQVGLAHEVAEFAPPLGTTLYNL